MRGLLRQIIQVKQLPWEKLVNRQGITWRKLPEDVKASVKDKTSAIALMLEKTSAIKRPVLEIDGRIILGFDGQRYCGEFGIKASG